MRNQESLERRGSERLRSLELESVKARYAVDRAIRGNHQLRKRTGSFIVRYREGERETNAMEMIESEQFRVTAIDKSKFLI